MKAQLSFSNIYIYCVVANRIGDGAYKMDCIGRNFHPCDGDVFDCVRKILAPPIDLTNQIRGGGGLHDPRRSFRTKNKTLRRMNDTVNRVCPSLRIRTPALKLRSKETESASVPMLLADVGDRNRH